MRDHQPIRVALSLNKFFGNWLTRRPDLHRAIIDRVANAQDLGDRVSGITPSAAKVETRGGARLEVAVKNMPVDSHLVAHSSQVRDAVVHFFFDRHRLNRLQSGAVVGTMLDTRSVDLFQSAATKLTPF
jgi:hypothetical protein